MNKIGARGSVAKNQKIWIFSYRNPHHIYTCSCTYSYCWNECDEYARKKRIQYSLSEIESKIRQAKRLSTLTQSEARVVFQKTDNKITISLETDNLNEAARKALAQKMVLPSISNVSIDDRENESNVIVSIHRFGPVKRESSLEISSSSIKKQIPLSRFSNVSEDHDEESQLLYPKAAN